MSFSTATAVPYGTRIGGQTMLRGSTLGVMAQSVGIIIAAASRYVLDTFASILGPTSFAVQVPGTWRMSAAQADSDDAAPLVATVLLADTLLLFPQVSFGASARLPTTVGSTTAVFRGLANGGYPPDAAGDTANRDVRFGGAHLLRRMTATGAELTDTWPKGDRQLWGVG